MSGNGYIEAAGVGGEVRELHALRPDRVQVIPGPDGWPEAWEYSAGGAKVRISGEPAPGVRAVLHLKLNHPANDRRQHVCELRRGQPRFLMPDGDLAPEIDNETSSLFPGARRARRR